MKGLLIGIFYLLFGICGIIVNIALYFVIQSDDCSDTHPPPQSNTTLWYYSCLTVVGVIGLCAYLAVAYCYKNRRRNNPVSDIMRVSMYF